MKLKNKLIIAIIIIVLAIIAIGTATTKAYYIGQKIRFGYADLVQEDGYMFCAERHQGMSREKKEYTCIAGIYIEGLTATDFSGHQTKSEANAVLAYVFGDSSTKLMRKQVAGWNYLKTWLRESGQYLDGLSVDYATENYEHRADNELAIAKDYAKSLKDEESIKDNTNQNAIAVTYTDEYENYTVVGPFKWEFPGNLNSITVIGENGKTANSADGTLLVGTYSNGGKLAKEDVSSIKSNTEFYILVSNDAEIDTIKTIKASGTSTVKTLEIWFFEATEEPYWQNLYTTTPGEKQINIEAELTYNIPLLTNLKVIKKDFDTDKTISGVTFKVQRQNGKYVKVSESGKVSYVAEESEGTLFKTDENGEAVVEGLQVGEYKIVEFTNSKPMYGGETGEVKASNIFYNTDGSSTRNPVGEDKVITISLTTGSNDYTTLYMYNKKAYVDLSGYVWEDLVSGKTNTTYDNGRGDIYDNEDTLVPGVTVHLRDASGNDVKDVQITDENGSYMFKNIEISELGNYYIEFEYNGLTYTSVNPLVGSDQSINSKAKENETTRKTLNNAFETITNSGSIENRNTGRAENSNATITYKNDVENYASYYESTSYNTTITADTNRAGFSIKEQYDNNNFKETEEGTAEIEYINLGIVKRETPNLSIKNDLTEVKVSVNGYGTTYKSSSDGTAYGTREDESNLSVKFKREYGNYYREIYPSDIQFSAELKENIDAKKLKVYATYTTTINNNSTNLNVSVSELANYYDADYSIVANGTAFPGDVTLNGAVLENGTVLNVKDGNSVNSYKTSYITIPQTIIEAGNSLAVNITYQVSDEAILSLLNSDKELSSVSEINAYSTYYGSGTYYKEECSVNDVYAGIDSNSAPGNATPGNTETYEDDTDNAPSFVLTAKGVRQIMGTVFEDETTLNENNERNGDGKYDESSEKTISGVTVDLIDKTTMESAVRYEDIYDSDEISVDKAEVSGTTINAESTTSKYITAANGYYIFKGIEPGEYLIKYIYENGKTKICNLDGTEYKDVTVQDYKSTILKGKVGDVYRNGADPYWYKVTEERFSDARDNYATREAIDNEIKEVTYQTNTSLTQNSMDAQTPEFTIPVEYSTVYTDSENNCYIHKINNVDFGIAERAKQEASLSKRVSNIKVTLANGQVVVDADPATHPNYVTYIDDNNPIVITLDSELIYGAHLEIQYELKLTNTSERDYNGDDGYYYYWGTTNDQSKLITITGATLLDYVDRDLEIKQDNNGAWSTVANVSDLVINGTDSNGNQLSDADNNQALLDQYRAVLKADPIDANAEVEPGQSVSTNISLEKVLATSDDLSYENNGEVVKVTKTGGSNLTTTLGSYAPVLLEDSSAVPAEVDEAKAATVAVMPPTGATNNVVIYTILGVATLAILGAGTYFVRRTLKSK